MLLTRSWRNWQTRKTKDLVGNSMQVQFLSTAPEIAESLNGIPLFFCVVYSLQTKYLYAGSREKYGQRKAVSFS